MAKNNHHIRIKPPTFDYEATKKLVAEKFMEAERRLTPLVKAKAMPANEAMVLIAMYGDGLFCGKSVEKDEHRMSEEDIIVACHSLIGLWQLGLFVPSPEYPYTLEETLKAGQQ